MVCTADDLLGWKDFPKGLKVLLLDGDDTSSSSEMRSKLEEMDYIVSIYSNEAEALSAILNKSECFHVAIIEVSTENVDGVFKFLETVKDLPTILVSNTHCLTTMMKCIALGAVEFLQKPLSDDKLRNIWQHVIHKAFNAGDKDVTDSFKPVKAESMVSLLQLQLLNNEEDSCDSSSLKNETLIKDHEMDTILSGSDKLPAPSTPQLKHGETSFDDIVFCGDHEIGEQEDGDCKSVETTSLNSMLVSTKEPSNSTPQDSFGTKANRKRTKVEWTPELHKKFVQAVEKLGVDQAIPSRILELMKVEGLTRHNVASHLQKYRLHRRHILPKDDNFRWANQPESTRSTYQLPQKPVMAYPPSYYPHHNHHLPPNQVHHPTWIPPHGNYSNGIMSWGSPYYPTWQIPTESWQWNPYSSGLNADVWGCPVIPPPHGQYPQVMPRPSDSFNGVQNPYNGSTLVNLSDLHPGEDEIDKIVKEAISKPWLPLPLGLKPPSTDSVLNELTKQGISTVPPPTLKGVHIPADNASIDSSHQKQGPHEIKRLIF